MPNPKTALEVLEAAKKAYKAKFTPGFYHGSGAGDIKEFIPSHRGATFVTRDPEFAESFHPIDEAASAMLNEGNIYKRGSTTYPLSVNMGKHFDVDNPEGKKFVEEFLSKQPNYFPHKLENYLGNQSWAAVENRDFMRALKKAGYDTFSIREGGVKNVGVFDPKNIRGKFAEYNPEHAESADFMKAEGGQINPIKTPREMLLDLVEIPHLAGGGMPIEMAKLVDQAIKKYVQLYKKMPPAEDIKALKAHAQAISQKPTIWHDPVTQARARHQLATDPNLMDPDAARDPFLTQAMTGRTVKGTQLQPKPLDIHDPSAQKEIGEFQLSSGMTNPTEELAGVATALENKAAEPIIEKLRMQFFKKNKRLPTQEELEAEIAAFNPLRHQYGTAGTSIVRSRPPTAKGMQEWKEQARVEGVPESYLEKSPADYRKNLQDELAIGRGEQPTVSPMADDLIANPDRQYAEGHSVAALSPGELQAMLIQNGYTPGKFKRKTMDLLRSGAHGAQRAGSAIAHSAPARVAGKTAGAVMSALGPVNAAWQSYDVGKRLANRDYLGAANSIASAGLGFAGIPGAIGSAGFEMLNSIRDKERKYYSTGEEEDFVPDEDYRSVMEGYR